MVCIYCSGETRVTNSRLQKRSNQTWRRRKCLTCQGLFTSLEQVDLTSSILFIKAKTATEPFQRDILFISVYEACKHRKQAVADAKALTDTIIGRLLGKVSEASVSRGDVISVTAEVLKRFDKAAATHYTAYHRL